MSGIVIDLQYQIDAVPLAGQEAQVAGFNMSPGGGFNAMVAAKRAGMDVTYGGLLGGGPLGAIAKEGLRNNHIDCLHARACGLDQGCSTVLVDNDGERTLIASSGAEGMVTDADLERIDPSQFGWVLLSGYALKYPGSTDAMTRWLQVAVGLKGLVFDPSPVIDLLPEQAVRAALNRAAWISSNAVEATVLTTIGDPLTAARRLATLSPATVGAVVRDGANGCFLAISGGDAIHIPGLSVQVVDTNGAGDTHLGSFVARLAAGSSPLDAVRYANVAAALAVTRHGPATAPTADEVNRRLSKPRNG